MRIRVKYFAYIRALVRDTKEEEVELGDGSKLIDLLMRLTEKYGDKFREMLFPSSNDKLSEEVIILLNGRSTDDLETPLKDGDTVSIMPFLSGG